VVRVGDDGERVPARYRSVETALASFEHKQQRRRLAEQGPSSNVLQALYDSEINFLVAPFWDCGFVVKLGDSLNGYNAEGLVDTWDEVQRRLLEQALQPFPDSDFARRYEMFGMPASPQYQEAAATIEMIGEMFGPACYPIVERLEL
jgi:hypothetical protein